MYVKWRVVSRGLSRGVRNGANHGNYSVYVKWREVFAMGAYHGNYSGYVKWRDVGVV